MPIEQGGLQYTIQIVDEFTEAALAFRKQLDLNKKAMTDFRKASSAFSRETKKAREEFNKFTAAQERSAKASRASARQTDKNAKANKELSTALVSVNREQQRVVSTARKLSRLRKVEAQSVKRLSGDTVKLISARTKLAREEIKAIKNSDALVRAHKRREQAQSRIRDAEFRVIDTTKRGTKAVGGQAQAMRLLERSTNRASTALARFQTQSSAGAAGLRRAGRGGIIEESVAISNRGIDRIGRARSQFTALAGSVKRAKRETSAFSRVFTRLLLAFTFFAAARAVVNTFRSMISEAIGFNSTVEQSILGIAVLLVAVGNVADAQGEATTKAEQFALAQIEARRQVNLLRKDGLKTAATFKDLANTFNVALAPGLQAGLRVDEIRKLTIRISQAAAAIGLGQEQLPEEIRSLLGGTINPRQTRIATALGITNEDINRFKELGTLSEELEIRFSAFAEAGEAALDTFQARLTNTADALQQLVAEGGLGFFNEIKGLLSDIQGTVAQITSEGVLIDPRAVFIAKQFFNGLRQGVAEARKLSSALKFEDLVRVSRTAGQVIAGAARLVSSIIQGFVRGLSTVTQVFSAVSAKVSELVQGSEQIFSVDNLQSGVELLTEFATVFFAVTATAKILSGIFFLLVVPIKAIVGAVSILASTLSFALLVVKGIGIAFGLISLPVIAIVAAVTAVGLILNQWVKDLTGADVRLGTIVRIVKVTLVSAFRLLAATAKLAFNGAVLVLETGIRGAVIAMTFAIRKLIGITAKVVSVFSEEAAEGLKSFEKSAEEAEKAQIASLKKRFETQKKLTAEAGAELKKTALDVGKTTGEEIISALANNANADTFSDFLEKGVDKFKQGSNGLLGTLGIDSNNFGFQQPAEQAKSLSETIAEIPPTIGKANSGLKDFSAELTKLDQLALQTKEDLEVGLQTFGTSGGLATQRRAFLEGDRKSRESVRKIETEITNIRSRQLGIANKLVTSTQRIRELDEESQDIVRRGVIAGGEIARKRREIAEITQQAAVAQIKSRRAAASFDQEEAENQLAIADASRLKLSLLEDELGVLNDRADLLTSNLEGKEADKVNTLIANRISLNGEDVLLAKDLKALIEARSQVEGKVNEIIRNRIRLTSEQEIRRLRQLQEEKAVELQTAKELFAVRGSINELEIRAAEARSNVANQELRVTQLVRENSLAEELLEINIKEAKTEEQKKILRAQQTELIKANAAAAQVELELLDQQKKELEAINSIAEQPIKFGVLQALKDFGADAKSDFLTTIRVMGTVLEGAATLWNDIIADALDPTARVDILQKFETFAQRIAQTILDAFLRARLFDLLTDVFGFSGADLQTLGLGFGRAGGGPITRGRGSPSLAHATAPGLATGGEVPGRSASFRPRGLDPRDTVPLWGQPGEHMQPVKRVKQFGLDFLEGIRKGLFDPAALRIAAGLSPRGRRRVAAPSGISLARGGSVANRRGASTSNGGGIKLVNVVTPELIHNELLTDTGQELLVNVIKANEEEF